MTNPTIPWQLQQLDPDTDAPRLMQDFEALQDWLLTEAIHRHHFQSVEFTYNSAIAAQTGVATVASITWPSPFASGVVPHVQVTVNIIGAVASGAHRAVIFVADQITNIGCNIGAFNSSTAASAAAGIRGVVTALDPTFDVSL